MKCEDCRASMPVFWDGALEDEERAEIEMHLASCTLCRGEAERLSEIWQGLGRIPDENPSRALRARFYEKLEAYQQGFAEAEVRARKPDLFSALRAWWSAHPAMQVGLSAAALVIGFTTGFLIDHKRDTTQVAQLRSEVSNMRQMVALSLLQQQGASERLKGVNWAYRVEQPDTEVLAALLYTVNHDPTVNVRLAAVDALRTYAESPVARKGMVQSIGKQESPLVQIALIDQLADLRDPNAVPALKGLLSDAAANVDVRQRAQWALGRIQ